MQFLFSNPKNWRDSLKTVMNLEEPVSWEGKKSLRSENQIQVIVFIYHYFYIKISKTKIVCDNNILVHLYDLEKL